MTQLRAVKVDLQNGKLTLNGFTTTNGEIAASGG